MTKYEPPYSVYMLDQRDVESAAEAGIVYSTGHPGEAREFARGLEDTGAAVVEVRDSTGKLVWRFPPWSDQ